MTEQFEPANLAIARANGGLLNLQPGDRVIDGEGEEATFVGYGERAPIYLNLRYDRFSMKLRLPNSEFRRTR